MRHSDLDYVLFYEPKIKIVQSTNSNSRIIEMNKTRTYFNPWHHVNYGTEAPQNVQAIIEIPKGFKAKYELDKASGLLRLDRVLFSAVHYPANYGFIPQTYCEDGDPLDILVFCSIDVEPLCIMDA